MVLLLFKNNHSKYDTLIYLVYPRTEAYYTLFN